MNSKWLNRIPVADALALFALFLTTGLVAGTFLRDDVFIYGDHAAQYWTLWYTFNVALPEHHRLVDWMPYWYAGYPELLFYPPGTVILGWLLNTLTLGKLPTTLIYGSIAFLAYALPAFTFYYALRRLDFEPRVAWAAGFLALGFPAFLDGAPAVIIGMTSSRLAFGVNALVLVWAIEFINTRRLHFAGLAGLALAWVVLLYPYHVIGLALALGIYVVIRRVPLGRASVCLTAIILFALALDAFWLVPLCTYWSGAMIPPLRSSFDQMWRLLTDRALLPYALLAIFAIGRACREPDGVRRAFLFALLTLPLLIMAAMLGWYALVIERFQFYQLDPVRLIGEFYFALIPLAAVGISRLSEWLTRGVPPRAHTPLAIFIVLLASVALLMPFVQTSAHFVRGEGEPHFLSQAIRDYRLDELWETLRASEGRVWFTSFYTRLNARGDETFPTTLAALTPLFSGRQIMGGTFARWTPVAALMWVGEIAPPALQGLPEDQDDRALFGVPIEEISDAQVYEYCRRFNITTIVASINDFRTRTFLDASPHFQSYYNNGYFFVYRVLGYANAWFEARNADVDLISFEDTEIVLRVRAAQGDASVNVKVYAYPLWRAHTDAGQSLPITRDDLALMRIALPPGENYTVTLRYEEGVVEQVGLGVSIVSAAMVIGGGLVSVLWRRG